MNAVSFDKRFFESSRGKIVMLLRRNDMTVNDLAANLSLSDNAVRAHLLSLERDGLIQQKGLIKGFRKPHYVYSLSENACELFPRPYGLLFNRLLTSFRSILSPSAFVERIREVGSGLGKENKSGGDADFDEKLGRAIAAIESLGGAAVTARSNGDVEIRSESCPFADAVAEHPEVCKVTESMLTEIIGHEVEEKCDRATSPKCRFQIANPQRV